MSKAFTKQNSKEEDPQTSIPQQQSKVFSPNQSAIKIETYFLLENDVAFKQHTEERIQVALPLQWVTNRGVQPWSKILRIPPSFASHKTSLAP